MPVTAAAEASEERARCEAPAEEFVAFAKGLMLARAARRLQALADSPAAEPFAQRLVQEALSGAPHAGTCLKLIGQLGSDPSWAARLQQGNTEGQPPPLESLPPKELEPAGRGLLVISRSKALPWIAGAYLKTTGKAALPLQTVLLEAVASGRELAWVLDAALKSAGSPVTSTMIANAIAAIEQQAARADTASAAAGSALLQLAKSVKGRQAARLLSSLMLGLLAEEPAKVGSSVSAPPVAPATDAGRSQGAAEPAEPASPPAMSGIAEAAWSDADEALGRALQEMDFLARSFERLESAAQGEAADRARRARKASSLVLQWVEQAAHYRRVAVLHKTGDRVPFDPAFHDLFGQADIGELVRIVKPAVVRGTEPEQIVLLRAETELD
jgi:hypothetical protein